jgi:hypothetical protein
MMQSVASFMAFPCIPYTLLIECTIYAVFTFETVVVT